MKSSLRQGCGFPIRQIAIGTNVIVRATRIDDRN